MLGRQLSPWTMAWFASALAFLVAALVALAAGAALPGEWSGGGALAVVHLAAIGWLMQAMCGALIQFVPVLSARALVLPALALPALVLLGCGALSLATGFLWLEGWGPGFPLLVAAPVLLGLGITAIFAMAGGTLVAARGWHDDAARQVLTAFAALGLVWVGGAFMVAGFAGWSGGAGFIAEGPALHAVIALGAWLSAATFGVSYRLFPMFLIAPEGNGPVRRATFALTLAMLVLSAGALFLIAAGRPVSPAPLLLFAAGATGLYLWDMSRVWRARRRPEPEINMRMARPALGFLVASLLLALVGAWRGGPWAEAAVFAAMAGWLSALTLAQMVKIVSFLTWIQVFAPRIGRGPVPQVADLVDDRACRRWLVLWLAGAALGTLALIFGLALPFRFAALVLLVAALGLIRALVAIRRLTRLPPASRPAPPPFILPPSTRRPTHDLLTPFRPRN